MRNSCGLTAARLATVFQAQATGHGIAQKRSAEKGCEVDAVVQTEKLTKFYGRHRGVTDVDLSVMRGEVFGFLGPNGAGKTTTIRLLLDHIRPSSGRATIFGIDTTVDPVASARRSGTRAG